MGYYKIRNDWKISKKEDDSYDFIYEINEITHTMFKSKVKNELRRYEVWCDGDLRGHITYKTYKEKFISLSDLRKEKIKKLLNSNEN